jgi:ACS family 4-hydroxyphenylacetate permease-like MFS transporter
MNNSPSMEQTRSEVLVPPSSEARPLDARQQSVINKLFRRLIVFLLFCSYSPTSTASTLALPA